MNFLNQLIYILLMLSLLNSKQRTLLTFFHLKLITDLYFLLTARLNNYKIIERPLVIYKRVAGEAKGGGTLFTKIKLTLRTLNYVYNLKKRKKF